jgi:16S rRNA (guanine527-N7)-methyltransferase
MHRYLHMLLEASRHMNLTSVCNPEQAWIRHIFDSLTLSARIPEKAKIIDVGSGGGLPGIVTAICRPSCQVTLLEATRRKAVFLEKAVRELHLGKVQVLCDRAENAGRNTAHRGHYDIVTARAVADLAELLELTAPFAAIDGLIMAMKGQEARNEAARAQAAAEILGITCTGIKPACSDPHYPGRIVLFRKQARTPGKYPRRPGIPHKRPLRACRTGLKKHEV